MKNTNIAAVFFIPICAVAARHGDYNGKSFIARRIGL